MTKNIINWFKETYKKELATYDNSLTNFNKWLQEDKNRQTILMNKIKNKMCYEEIAVDYSTSIIVIKYYENKGF